MSRLRHAHLALLCGLVILAFALRATSLDAQSMWRDEVDALRFATASWSELLNTFRQPGWNGPLYFALLRGWIALAGQTPFALRYFSLLPGVLAVPLMYGLGRRLSGNRFEVGGLAAALVTASPYFVWYSQETKMYALVSALVILAVYALRRALQGRTGWWVVMVIATSLCVYLHILAALLILIEFLLFLLWRPSTLRKWIEAGLSFACLTLPYLPLLNWQFRLLLTPAKTGYPFYSLPEMMNILLYGFAAGVAGYASNSPLVAVSHVIHVPPMAIVQAVGWVLMVPLLILVIVGACFGSARLHDRLGLVVWIFLPILALYAVSLLHGPIFTDRYLIWIGLAAYLLAALGVWALWQASRLVGVAALVLLLVPFGQGVRAQATQPIKSDFRGAANLIAQRAGPDDLFIFQIPHIRYTFDYYYPHNRPFEWKDGLFTNYGMTDADVDAQMRELIGAHRVVWLVASEMPMWDQKLQVFNWLETHMRRTDEAHFRLVDVYRYEAP